MQEITKIKPGQSWINLDLKDLWIYRELLYFLTLRDVKMRYKQTAIGVFWADFAACFDDGDFYVLFSSFARFRFE